MIIAIERLASSEPELEIEEVDAETAEETPSRAIAYSAREAEAVAVIKFESSVEEAE